MTSRAGMARNALVISATTVIVLGGLMWLLSASTSTSPQLPQPPSSQRGANASASGSSEPQANSANSAYGRTLVVYCAAGIMKPVAAAASAFQQEFDVDVQLQYGGSGTLLTNLQVAKRGDLYVAADTSYIELARQRNLLDEALPIARIRPVIAVKRGNAKNIHSIDDLLRGDVSFALANPDAASIGKQTRTLLESGGHWIAAEAAAKVFKPTVNDVATDVKLGVVDAAVVWDANVRQMPSLEMVRVPLFDEAVQEVTVGVLKTCRQPPTALMFARYLQAPQKGQVFFEQNGYETVDGDEWTEVPTLTLYSGGLNRIAIQDTLRDFEQREGVNVNVVYNGCGILVGMMKVGGLPDAYFSCDVSYLEQVRDRFLPPLDVSETDMIVIVQKGNPQGIHSLEDLARPGLKIAVANEEQSALGGLTKRLLQQLGLYEHVKKNVKVTSPTADFLVNQMGVGSLDAALVYRANVSQVRDKFEIIPITQGNPTAVQPIAVSKNSPHKYLARRLVEAITSNQSRHRFEAADFRWRLGPS